MKHKLFIILAAAVLFSLTGCSEEKIREAAQGIASEINSASGNSSSTPTPTSLPGLSIENNGGGAAVGYEYEDEATKLTEDTTYYNEYLGLSYTLPAGWWLYTLTEDNFSATQGVTGDYSLLDISRGETYTYMNLISCANLQYSTKDNHVGVDLYAESVIGVDTLEGYVEDALDYLLEPYEDETYELISQDAFTHNGIEYTICYIYVDRESEPYEMLYAFCELENDYYLTVNLNYWIENTDVEKILKDKVLANLSIQ